MILDPRIYEEKYFSKDSEWSIAILEGKERMKQNQM